MEQLAAVWLLFWSYIRVDVELDNFVFYLSYCSCIGHRDCDQTQFCGSFLAH